MLTNIYECLPITLRSWRSLCDHCELMANGIRKPILHTFATGETSITFETPQKRPRMLTNRYECLAIVCDHYEFMANCIRKPIRHIFATVWEQHNRWLIMNNRCPTQEQHLDFWTMAYVGAVYCLLKKCDKTILLFVLDRRLFFLRESGMDLVSGWELFVWPFHVLQAPPIIALFFFLFRVFHTIFPNCGRMPLPALSLWPGRQPCRPRLVDGRRGGEPSSVAPRSRNPLTGRRRDSPIFSSLFSHGPPIGAGPLQIQPAKTRPPPVPFWRRLARMSGCLSRASTCCYLQTSRASWLCAWSSSATSIC